MLFCARRTSEESERRKATNVRASTLPVVSTTKRTTFADWDSGGVGVGRTPESGRNCAGTWTPLSVNSGDPVGQSANTA
jgi:hypothetical protein